MMEIRRVTADEMAQRRKIWNIAFERERRDEPDEDAEDALEHPPEWTWACVENGAIKACMVEIQFLMCVDSSEREDVRHRRHRRPAGSL